MFKKYSYIVLSALLQAFVINNLITSANLVSSGFTGVSILVNAIFLSFDINVSISSLILMLNVPVALICFKYISKQFMVLSIIQFMLVSVFVQVIPNVLILDDILLNIVFGGVLYGFAISLALKVGGSTGGVDFITLFCSEKYNKSFFKHTFIFNVIIILIFGYFSGISACLYSIIFQYISYVSIEKFYNYYNFYTLEIITKIPDEVVSAYQSNFKHGVTILNGIGGYNKQDLALLNTTISQSEYDSVIKILKQADEKCIITVLKTENFVGGFKRIPR